MLSSLGWPSLQLRRKCARLTLLFKLLHNFLVILPEYLPVPSPVTTTKANHDFKFLHYQNSIDCYKFSFFQEQFQNGMLSHHIYVTGFWKTNQIVTLGLFFIGPANGHTRTLHIHSAITRLGGLVCFSRASFANPVNS